LSLTFLLLLPTTLALNTRKLQQEQTSLLQKTSQGRAKTPVPANFFDEFDQGESTIDQAFYSNIDFPGHLEPSALIHGDSPGSSEQFFVETPSAGATEAWQTYPGLGDVPANREAHEGTWIRGEAGYWQTYSGSPYGYGGSSTSANDASWFDSMTQNYNGLGEPQLPPFTDAKRLQNVMPGREWVQRAVNTTLTCQAAGCSAASQLNVFDASSEEGQFCRLNIDVHPTDFDNALSREFVKFFKVNDHMASGQCQVHKLMGCNASAWRPLVPCVQDLSVDHLLGDGSLVIEAQINSMVDECPFEGNLLSAVAMATCMVRNKTNMSALVRAKPTTVGEASSTSAIGAGVSNGTLAGESQNGTGHVAAYEDLLPGSIHQYEAKMQCGSPGCTARSIMTIDTQVLRAGAICMMNLSIVQTDFDESVENDTERIEFINVSSLGAVATNLKPGRNPCTEEYSSGTKIGILDKVYQVVANRNVTDAIRAKPFGLLVLDGKISPQVDDCGNDNQLFDGTVLVECTIPESS